VKSLNSGLEIAEFSVAVNTREKHGEDWEDRASFFDVTKFKPGGLAQYLTKGQQVAISGRLRQERWQNQEGQNRSKVKIVAQDVELVGGRQENRSSGSGVSGNEGPESEDFPDGIPF
jgi:single-strand DNA-binding protein